MHFLPGNSNGKVQVQENTTSIVFQHAIEQYNLNENTKNGFVYLEIWQAIYGLPQAGSLANKQLR